MMPFRRYEKYAAHLNNLGYDTTPVNGKRPIIEGWSKRPDEALAYEKNAERSIGVLCGGKYNLIAIDVDVKNLFCIKQMKKLISAELGEAPIRIGNDPKFLMVFACTKNISKQKTGVYVIDNADSAVEILGEGQQFVASGIHPDTKSLYTWPEDSIMDIPPTKLTLLTPKQVEDFRAQASQLLSNYGDLKGRVSTRKLGGLNLTELDGKVNEIEAALMHLPNNDEHYDDWVNTLHAIKGAIGEDGCELAHRWSQRSNKYDEAMTDRTWNSIKNVKSIGAGSIYHWASGHGFNINEMREEQRPRPDQLEKIEDAAMDNSLLRASEIRGPVPPREWLLDQWFPTKAVSALFGQGGVGKTLLTQQLANCVAMGKPFLGIETRRMPVLAVFCEDDIQELSRRQLYINEWLDIHDFTGSAPDNFFLWPRVGEDNILVTFPSQGEDRPGKFYGELVEQGQWIKDDTQADEIMIIIDTASDTFGGNENIRREVNTYIKTYLGSFCVHYNATVIMLAHPSLSGLSSGSGMSGSTAWENSVRARAYFSRSIDDQDDVRTLSRKKSNYSISGQGTDMTLLWDAGVYQLPASQTQVDRIEQRALKKRILEAVEQASAENNPFRMKAGRKIKDALPAILGERISVVMRAVRDLEIAGEIIMTPRNGYATKRGISG